MFKFFLDSYRFLDASLEKLSRSMTSVPLSDANGMENELFKKIANQHKKKLLIPSTNH